MPAPAARPHLSAPSVPDRAASRGVHAATFVLWLLVGFSAVAWGLRLWPAASSGPVAELAVPPPANTAAEMAQALGAPRTAVQAPTLASRLQLVGVMADADGGGAALIAIDGQPAKPYRIGKPVLDGLVLQSVQPRSAALGERAGGTAALTLSLPARP